MALNIDYFLKHGGRNAPFQEEYYMANNPDVAAAVRAGQFVSGSQHFQMHGFQEGRVGYAAPPAPPPEPPKPLMSQYQAPQAPSQASASATNQAREAAKKRRGKASTLLSGFGGTRARTSAAQGAAIASLGLATTSKKTLLGIG